MSEQPSERVVQQGIRNRVIEYLELAASFEEQRDYQGAAPIADVVNEVVNQFDDWVHDLPDPSRVYSAAEVEELRAYEVVLDRANAPRPVGSPWLTRRRCRSGVSSV